MEPTLVITPELDNRTNRLDHYLIYYKENCINVPHEGSSDEQIIAYSTILIDYVRKTGLYQLRYPELFRYFKSVIVNGIETDPVSFALFIDFLTQEMAIIAVKCIPTIQDEKYHSYTFINPEGVKITHTMQLWPPPKASPNVNISFPTETGIKTLPVSQGELEKFTERYLKIGQGKVLDVSQMHVGSTMGARIVNTPRPGSGKYGVTDIKLPGYERPDIKIVSNNWNTYIWAIALLKSDKINDPYVLALKQKLR